MSETISTFEKHRYIERTQSSEHRRILKISLTPKGRALLTACNEEVARLEKKFLAALDPRETANLSDYLRRILNSQ
jgi:DNA-binding MarR family transcriptional regulator